MPNGARVQNKCRLERRDRQPPILPYTRVRFIGSSTPSQINQAVLFRMAYPIHLTLCSDVNALDPFALRVFFKRSKSEFWLAYANTASITHTRLRHCTALYE